MFAATSRTHYDKWTLARPAALGAFFRMSSHDEESTLIQQAVAGDRGALAQLLLSHHDSLERHIRQLLSSEPNRVLHFEDILQQTFVRAAGSVRGFEQRPGVSFRAWLKTIAANLIRDAGRRHRLERRAWGTAVAGNDHLDDDSVVLIVERCVADVTPPARRAQREDNLRCLREAIAHLPDEQRDILVRHYLHEQSLEQIAEATGRTKDAIRGMCYRARRTLRDMMGRSSLYFSN